MYRVSHNDDRNESNQNRYSPTIMSPEDVAAGKPSYWPELLIGGKVINLSPRLFCEPFIHLTSLLIENNHIIEIPPEINKLVHLQILNANNNHLMAVPKELGECIELRKLLLANNRIRLIPYELGKLYNIQELDLQKNPLAVEFSNIYHTSNGTHFLQLYLLDHCKGPCLITSRNYGKKVHNTSGYHYRPNFFFYNQWYAPVANVPTAPYATTAYQNESLETQFSRLTLQKHGTPLVLTPSSISPHLLSSPHSSSNIYWRPRNNYNINRFQRKSKPIPQQHLNIENPLLYSIPGCVLPRSSSKRKKRKKRDRNNKSKTVTNDDDRSQDFLSKITSISDIELSLTTDTSSSDTTSNSISCHCCVCDPFGQIWNVEQLMISSPRSKFNSSTSYSTNNNTANTLKNFKTDKEQHRHFEVSSQIITAPNGHKDLEIQFRRLPSPPRRPMISLLPPYNSTKTFSVMSYNVLSDKYASSSMYNYCPKWALAWPYRKERILMEIVNQQADIVCLQEVEWEQFNVLFSPHLLTLGYTGIYSPKSRAKTMHENDRKFVDGCAIFFKNTKFVLIKEVLIEFNQLAMANAEGIEHMLNRVMTKDNIGLAAVLHTIETDGSGAHFHVPQHLIVCNAHIHWDPEYCDVKLIQVMMLTSEISRLIDESRDCYKYSKCDNVHVLIAGDFNSLPDSGVIEFLSRGRVSQDHRDFKQLSYKSCLDKLTSICDISNEFTHSISLASAYTDEMIPYTNYSYTFKGIIDYIFYSKGTLRVLNVLGPVSEEWFNDYNVVGCPNPIIPSDHFPLYAQFEMMDLASMANGLTTHR